MPDRINQEKAWSDFRVGVITFIGLAFLVIGVVFAGGDKGLLFRRTVSVHAHLPDVGGLKKGSSVTMGGMTIGRVSDIAFVEVAKGSKGNPGNLIEVTMEVRSEIRDRIKTDSIPSVRTQGMLGDRYLDISMGSEGAEPAREGVPLHGEGASDFDKTLRQATDVLNEAEELLTAVNEQQGSAGQFVYDQEFYNTLTKVMKELDDLIQDFKKHPRKYLKFSLF